MKLIICVDKNKGLAFNKRRQSRDEKLVADIMQLTEGAVLWIDEYSELLFEGCDYSIHDGSTAIGVEDYYFSERGIIPEGDVSSYIVYNWGKAYPSDKKLEVDLKKLTLVDKKEFSGKSHDKIVRETYNSK